jgi:hypothetical protein
MPTTGRSMPLPEHTDEKLAEVKRLLLEADEIVCSLPAPRVPRGSYFEAWSALGELHSLIGRLWLALDRST